MPKVNIPLNPINYKVVSGQTWKVSGLRVDNNFANSNLFTESTSRRASGYYYSELGAWSTGVYSTSGQFDNPNIGISWNLIHPKNNTIFADDALYNPFLKTCEVNIRSLDGTLKTGINYIDDGRISDVELVSGGSGYINPQVYISGDGAGAAIQVETFGSGAYSNLSGYSANIGISGYSTGIKNIEVVSGGSGYTAGNTFLVVSGSGNDQHTIGDIALPIQGGDGVTTSGSGAYIKVLTDGLGLRQGYYQSTSIKIPFSLNKDIFGGEGERKFVTEVITTDFYGYKATGRIIVDFPSPRFDTAKILKTNQGLDFSITPKSDQFFENQAFEDISLDKIEIHRGNSADFAVVTGNESSTLFHSFSVPRVENRTEYLEEINIPKSKFRNEDFFSGYFYKIIPYDLFGSGQTLEIGTGIRIQDIEDVVEIPSGFRLLVDQDKAIGTNIQGDTVTNTYLSWKRDNNFNIAQYEVVLEDQVDQDSHTITINPPQISGINLMISGTGASRADIDPVTNIQFSSEDSPEGMFDIFTPYSTSGIQWSEHTVFFDSERLPSISNANISQEQSVDVAAGNTASGYLYFTGGLITGHKRYGENVKTISYAAANTFLQLSDNYEPHALVARNVAGEVITEYEPKVKIPTVKGGSYSFKARACNAKGEKSQYSKVQNFTASGASSHFAFVPAASQLRLGGTGDITVDGNFATTVGGSGIVAVGDGIVVVGGIENRATGEAAALVGGSGNRLIGNVGDPQEGHFLGGGALNTGSGQYAAIVGGFRNSAQAHASFLGGGTRNYIPHDVLGNDASTATSYSLIGGGLDNTVSGTASIIIGGRDNKIGTNAGIGETTATRFVSWDNTFGAPYSTIAGGEGNELYGSHSFIGGGYQNIVHSDFTYGGNILGGSSNVISGTATSAGDAILAGIGNKLVSAGTALAGGAYSSGTADYTLALGARSWAAHKGAFVLSDSLVPAAEVDGTIAKKSHGEDTLNLFFENGAYLRNGSLHISGDLFVSGAASFAGGGAAIDGVGAAGYVASWTDTNTIQTGALYNLAGGNVGIGVITPQATLQVNGNASITGELRTAANVGINVAPIARTHIYQSGDSQPALLVEGSQGSLFSVEDSLTGSLMSVNDIAGLPVFEAFDDGTIAMGQYNSGDFIVTGNSVGIGTSSPSHKLDVKGTISVTADGTNYPAIYFDDHGNSPNYTRHIKSLGHTLQISDTEAGAGINIVGPNSSTNLLHVYDASSNSYFDIDSNLNIARFDTPRVLIGEGIGGGGALLTVSGNASISGEARFNDKVGIGVAPDVRFFVSASESDVLAKFINTDTTDGIGLIVKAGGTAADKYVADFRDGSNNTRLKIFADGRTDIQGGDTRLRADTYVSGNLYVSGSVVTADGTSPDHVSGLSGYFGKVGIGTTQMGADARLVVENGNVGIGTTNPYYTLEVRGGDIWLDQGEDIRFGGSSHRIRRVDSDEFRMQASTADDYITFYAGADLERMRIESDGKVAIGGEGNAAATAMLTVSGDASITGEFTTNAGAQFNKGQGDFDFRVRSDNKNQMFFIDASTDRVGIGTVEPVRLLDLYEGATHTFQAIRAGTTHKATIAFYDVASEMFDISYDNSDDKMYLASSSDTSKGIIIERGGGNVGVGTAFPSGRLHVHNAGTGIIVANEHITGNAFEVHGAQGNLLTITDDLSDSLMSVNDAAGMPVFEVFADDTIKSYRNNESKFEIDPDNNRIRLRDHVFVSGNLVVSGDVTSSTATHESTSYTASTHMSGLSGYFGKLGVGTGNMSATAVLVTKPGARVGIGTSNPSKHLSVLAPTDGNIANFGMMGDDYGIWMANGQSNDPYIGIGDWHNDAAYLRWDSNNAYFSIRFDGASEDRFAISDEGNVFIGAGTEGSVRTLGAMLAVSGDASITGELRVDNNLLVADAANDRVGIGTAAPAKNLEVYAASEPRIRVTAGTDSNAGYEWAEGSTRKWVIYNENSDDNLQFKTDSDVRMVIEQGGNVGIGTVTPSGLLHVDGDGFFASAEGVGNVGIGTTSASYGLAVMDNLAGGESLIELSNIGSSANSKAGISMLTAEGETNRWRARIVTQADGTNKGKLTIRTRNATGPHSDALAVYHDGKVQISPDQNVDPQALLTVSGDASITGELTAASGKILGYQHHAYGLPIPAMGSHDDSIFQVLRRDGTIGMSCGVDELNQFWMMHQNFTSPAANPFLLQPREGSVGIGCMAAADTKGRILSVNGDAGITGELRVNSDIVMPQDKYLYFEGDADDALNRIGRNNSENAILTTSRFHIANIIDSNNDDTNAEFSVRHNGTTIAGSTSLFSVNAGGTSTFSHGGNLGGGFDTSVYIDTYNSTGDNTSTLALRKSRNNTVGVVAQTVDGDNLGTIQFHGVRTDSAFMASSYISAIQSDTSTAAYVPSDLVFATSTNSALTEKMRIAKEGVVGVGTTVPTGRMHIYQSGDAIPALLVEGSQGSLFSVEDSLTGSLMSVNDIAGLPVFEAFDDGTIVMGQYNSGDFIVTGNQVGIGTPTPSAKLTVKSDGVGNVFYVEALDGSHLGGFYEESDGRAAFNVRNAGGTATINLDAGGDSWFAGGDVGIGTTNPGYRLHATGITNYYVANFQGHAPGSAGYTAGQSYGMRIDAGSTSADRALVVRNAAQSAEFLTVKGNGEVGINTTTTAGSKLTVNGDTSISGRLSVKNDLYVYDNDSTDIIFRVIDSADDGIVQVYVNGSVASQIGANDTTYFNRYGGNVGIGTSATKNLLTVKGKTTLDDDAYVSGNLYVSGAIISADDATNDHVSGLSGYFGKIGIGTTLLAGGNADTAERLRVHGKAVFDNATDPSTLAAEVPTTVYINDQADSTLGFGRRAGGTQADFIIGNCNSDASFRISRHINDLGSASNFVMDSAGSIGIGTSLPDGSKLRVNGDVGITGEIRGYHSLKITDGVSALPTLPGSQIGLFSNNSVTSPTHWQLGIEGDNDAGIVFHEDDTQRGHVGWDHGRDRVLLGDHANDSYWGVTYSSDQLFGVINGSDKFAIDATATQVTGEFKVGHSGLVVRSAIPADVPDMFPGATSAIPLTQVGIGTRNPGSAAESALITKSPTALELCGSYFDTRFYINSFSSQAGSAPEIHFVKSTNNIKGTFSATAEHEVLGGLKFFGSDSSSTPSLCAAAIYAQQDGAAGATYVPGRIMFRTSDGSTSAESSSSKNTAEMSLHSDGKLLIGEGHNPTALLTVSGDASISGEIRGSNNVVIPDGQHFKWSPGGDTFIHGSSASDFIGAVVGSEQFRVDATATQVTGDLRVARFIKHGGDEGTKIDFGSTEIDLFANEIKGISVKTTEVAINDNSADVNFRVESDNSENMIFVDAGNDLVGFGTPSPSPSFTVTVSGGLAADYKSFVINHPDPDKPNKDLVHGSSETDEHNVFVRGQAQSKIIDLPDYWPHLIHEHSITVQLTPIGDHQELYVESIKDNRILINNKKQNKINCFYLVHAERKDIGKLEVEPDKCNKE